MTQGDTFTDGAATSVAGGATSTIDVTAASGNHVLVESLSISHNGFGSTGESMIGPVDTSGPTEFFDSDGNPNNGAYVGTGQTSGGDGVDANVSVSIDDTIGLRVKLINEACSSGTGWHHISGIQIK